MYDFDEDFINIIGVGFISQLNYSRTKKPKRRIGYVCTDNNKNNAKRERKAKAGSKAQRANNKQSD